MSSSSPVLCTGTLYCGSGVGSCGSQVETSRGLSGAVSGRRGAVAPAVRSTCCTCVAPMEMRCLRRKGSGETFHSSGDGPCLAAHVPVRLHLCPSLTADISSHRPSGTTRHCRSTYGYLWPPRTSRILGPYSLQTSSPIPPDKVTVRCMTSPPAPILLQTTASPPPARGSEIVGERPAFGNSFHRCPRYK